MSCQGRIADQNIGRPNAISNRPIVFIATA